MRLAGRCGKIRAMRDLPVACALTPDELAIRRGTLTELVALAASRDSTALGWRLTFPASSGTLEHIARAIDAERRCCEFLRFVLTVDQAGAPFVLDITGPATAREFLDDLLSSDATGRLESA